MTAPSFTYSGNVYTGAAAGTVDFALTSTTGNAIAYLQPSHIHVYKSSNQGSTWVELTRPGQWDYVTSGTVARLVTGITAGDWVKVQRITPSTSAYVTFQSSSLLTADQLNDDTLFNTYLNQERYDQGDQSSVVAAAATTAATAATTASTTATATANAASTAAAAATTTANAASASAATALSQSNTAITDSAAALAASANAVSTANTAATNAASAVTTAGTANTNATAAVNTANTAASNASTALSQSTTALANSATALSTANTAASNASTALTNSSNAVTTANTASTNASNAVTTANTANTNATAALNAVASSLQYVLVANVAAIPSSPANNYAIEVADSTGVESFSPLANRPAGFVGDTGLSVRMQYSTTGPTWNWLNYFPNNAETRYLKLSGGTLTGQLRADDSTSVAAPVIAFDGDTNTGVARTGADELALVTGGTARLTIDSAGGVAIPGILGVTGAITGSLSGAASLNVLKAGDTMTGSLTATALIPSGSTVPTNGLYLPSAGSVAISTSGAQRLVVDASGRVGVGNTSPTSALHIDVASGEPFRLRSQTAGFNYFTHVNHAGGDLAYVGAAGGGALTSGTTSDYAIRANQGSLLFGTNGNNERLRITSAGLVGIGTSSVSDPLHVVGTIRTSSGSNNAQFANNFLRANVAGTFYFDQNTGGQDFQFRVSNVTNLDTTALTITSAGRLGIGNTAPGGLLHLGNGTSNSDIILDKPEAGAGTLKFFKGGSASAYIQYDASEDLVYYSPSGAGSHIFYTGGNEAARIDSSRRLLVGTSSSPTSELKLAVNGPVGASDYFCHTSNKSLQVKFYNTGDSGQYLGLAAEDAVTAVDGNTLKVFKQGSAVERVRINADGELLVGYTSDNGSYKLQVNSQIFATSATIATSDGRYKENVASLGDCIALVKALRPVSFTWRPQQNIAYTDDDGKEVLVREGHNFPDGTQIGFIAQEVQQVLAGRPWLSSVIKENARPAVTDADGNELAPKEEFLGIAEGNLIAVLTSALQEAIAKIETLEASNADLLTRVSALESA